MLNQWIGLRFWEDLNLRGLINSSENMFLIRVLHSFLADTSKANV